MERQRVFARRCCSIFLLLQVLFINTQRLNDEEPETSLLKSEGQCLSTELAKDGD